MRTVWRRLGDDKGRRYFTEAEQSWETYERNECVSRSRGWSARHAPHSYAGGTSAPLRFAACEVALTHARIGELMKTAAALAPH